MPGALYREAQERVALHEPRLVQPPVDRHRPPDEVADVYVHVERESDAGLVVSGAKVVATGSALTHYNFIAHPSTAVQSRRRSRAHVHGAHERGGRQARLPPSYAMAADVMGSPFDYPLSSRFDENDAILVLDKVLVPWRTCSSTRTSRRRRRSSRTPASSRAPCSTACTRLAVKLDFVAACC